MPGCTKVELFADYVLSTYIEDSAMFPPNIWAETPASTRRTNNEPEAFHSHFNEQFYICLTHFTFWHKRHHVIKWSRGTVGTLVLMTG